MRDSRHKALLATVFGILIAIGAVALYLWQRGDASLVRPQSDITRGYEDAIEVMNDPAFTSYVANTLAVQCPFYIPDGAGYRDCLWDVVNKNEDAYTKTTPSSQEIDEECQTVVAHLDGLVAGEVVLSCRAYKLSL